MMPRQKRVSPAVACRSEKTASVYTGRPTANGNNRFTELYKHAIYFCTKILSNLALALLFLSLSLCIAFVLYTHATYAIHPFGFGADAKTLGCL